MSKYLKFMDRPKFHPQRFYGLQLWLDASDASTITKDGSGFVSQWSDKSGNANHATQGTGSNQPLTGVTLQNAKNVIDFDGGDALALPSGVYSLPYGSNTVFVVAKTSLNTIQQRMINMTNAFSSDYGIEYSSTSGQLVFFNNPSGTGINKTGVTKSNFNIICCKRDATSVSIAINSGTASSNSNGLDVPGINEASIGAYQSSSLFLTGSIAEIIAYNRFLSAVEIKQVEVYLSEKWEISL